MHAAKRALEEDASGVREEAVVRELVYNLRVRAICTKGDERDVDGAEKSLEIGRD